MYLFQTRGIMPGMFGGRRMTHDLEDLLNLIKELEERIIKLESKDKAQRLVQHEDSWYWEHG